MKKIFIKWLVEKVFKTEIVEIVVPTRFVLKHYVTKDGSWHHIARSVEFWVRDGKVIQKNETTFKDGVFYDEVRVWNDTTKGKISKTSLKGTETNLIAYWKL